MVTTTIEQEPLLVYLSLPNQEVNRGNDIAPYLTPLEISRTSGGRRLDYAVFDWNLGYTGGHVQNLQTPFDWAREVEIWSFINGQLTPIFWGDLTTQTIQIDESEQVQVQANVMPYHFGEICKGFPVYNNLTDPPTQVTLDDDIVFNPVIDGVVYPNKSDKKNITAGAGGSNLYNLWVDPESQRTVEAQTANGQTATMWTIPDAVAAICWTLNPDETYIKNFDEFDTEYDELFDDAPVIRDVSFKRGYYLPEYLDALLLPLGFDWYVKLSLDGNSKMERRIVVFKRGSGEEKTLKLAKFGEAADFATTNVEAVQVTTDIGRTINKVVCHGALQKREMTIELYRAWPEADDSLDADDIRISDDTSSYESKPNVWRKFVANEAGDYSGTRTTVQWIPDTPLDLSDEFDDYVPRRRRFFEPLTLNDEGLPREPWLEYYDGSSWNPVPDAWQGTWKVLTKEMGIYFISDAPPQEMIDIGNNLKLRLTATVVGDSRIEGEASNIEESPSARENVLFLDVSDRFFDSVRVATGLYPSQLSGDSLEVDDDQDKITAFAEAILEQEVAAAMAANLQLMGLQATYGIGDLLTEIEGRNISLNRKSELASEGKYPQVVGVVWNPQEPSTRLIVDTNEGLG